MKHPIKMTFPTLLVALLLWLTACSPEPASTSSRTNTTPVGSGVQDVHVFVEPDAGDGTIIDAITGAHRSIWLEIYILSDQRITNALMEAAHRGLDVRVLLEIHPYGSGLIPPRKMLDRLSAAGVQARASNPTFALTHEKGMLIDDTSAYIMTCNFSLSALGRGRSTLNREYGIIDTHAQDIQAVHNIFQADWDHTSTTITNSNLIVSPQNSRHALTTLIQRTRTTLWIEAEELQDSEIERALIDATHRHVQVHIILPAPTSGTTDSNHQGIATVETAGVSVREDTRLYMHAKIMIADGRAAFVGSENFSAASLDSNRELGILVASQNVLSTIERAFQQDWNDSHDI